jgi:hypothetical protein
VKPGPVCPAPDFSAGIQVSLERFIRRGRTDARHRNTQILQHRASRRVSRQRWQGRRQVTRSEPPAADDDRGKNWTASRYPAGVLPVGRQADHRRRVLGRAIAPGMGAQSMGKSFGACRGRHGIFRRDGARVAGRGARTRVDSGRRHGAGHRRVPIQDRSRHPIVRVVAASGMSEQRPDMDKHVCRTS